jgi:hypothetical protein
MSVEHNEENIEKLAQFVVDGFDLDTLMGIAKDNIEYNYRNNPKLFQREWDELMVDRG